MPLIVRPLGRQFVGPLLPETKQKYPYLCRGLAMLGTSGLTIIKRYKSSELPAEAKDEHLILDGALLTSAIFIFWPIRTLTPVVYSTSNSPFPVAYSLSMLNSRSVAMESQAAGMSASLTLPWFARTLPICLDEVDYDYNAVQNQHPKYGFNLDLSLSLV